MAEILQISRDSHRAAPAFAESAEENVWETCELVPAGLAERSALRAVLQLICRSLGRGDHISLPSAEQGGDFAVASKSQCRFFVLHFQFPWVLWLIINASDSLPCLFTPVLQPVSRLLVTDAGPGSLSWGCWHQAGNTCVPAPIVWEVCIV